MPQTDNHLPTLILSFKGKKIDSFQLNEGTITIGRDPSNSHIIDSLAIAPEQLAISYEQQQFFVESLSEQFPSYLNGQLLTKSLFLAGDIINLKKHDLAFPKLTEASTDSEEEELAKEVPEVNTEVFKENSTLISADLQLVSGKDIGRVIPLKQAVTEIITDNEVSAIIVKKNNGFYISRLIDSIEISINGSKLSQEQQLHDGEVIQIAKQQYCFFVE